MSDVQRLVGGWVHQIHHLRYIKYLKTLTCGSTLTDNQSWICWQHHQIHSFVVLAELCKAKFSEMSMLIKIGPNHVFLEKPKLEDSIYSRNILHLGRHATSWSVHKSTNNKENQITRKKRHEKERKTRPRWSVRISWTFILILRTFKYKLMKKKNWE